MSIQILVNFFRVLLEVLAQKVESNFRRRMPEVPKNYKKTPHSDCYRNVVQNLTSDSVGKNFFDFFPTWTILS